jgi:hypothetical protein
MFTTVRMNQNAEPKHSAWHMLGENVLSRNPLSNLAIENTFSPMQFLKTPKNWLKKKKARKAKLVMTKRIGKEKRTKDSNNFFRQKSKKQMLTDVALCSIRK